MEYITINFDGNVRLWISTIMSGHEHILVQAEGGKQLAKEPALSTETLKDGGVKLIGLFTSASTGDAKSIWNSFDNLLQNARITAREFNIKSGDRLLMMAKPWHIAGVSWMLMANKIGVEWRFIPTKSGEVEKWHQAIADFNPDCLLTVPSVLAQLMEYSDWFVPKIVFGGAALDSEYYPVLSQYCDTVYQAYGQTEAAGLISCKKVDSNRPFLNNINCCFGHPPKEFAVRCEGSANNPRPIFLKSPALIHNSYYDTGDLGYFDNTQNLFLSGRG